MKRSRIRQGVTVEWGDGGRAFVLLGASGDAFLSNAVAGFVLARLREGLSDDAIASRIVRAFDVDRARARKDVVAFVRTLRDRGVLADGA